MTHKEQEQSEEIVEKNIEEIQAENQTFYDELTAKNADYFFRLNRSLKEKQIDEFDRVSVLNQMMEEAVEKQSEGITARKLFGTVSQQVDYIIHGPVEEEVEKEPLELSPPWQLYVDGALLVGGVFAILSAVSEAMSRSENSQLGLVSMIANYLIGGLVMLAITTTAPRPGQDNNYWKYFGASIGSIALWAISAALINIYIPTSINIPIPPIISLPIGIISLVLKWWFKRRYQVVGGIF